MRLDKYLSNAGIASRSQVKKIIKSGQVRVNGRIVRDPSYEVTENDVVECFNQRVEPPKHLYLVLYKPAGYVCDKVDDANVFDLIDHPRIRQLHAVGRLDKDVEGVLILTSDGWFTHLLIDPKSRLEREYLVWVQGKLTEEMKNAVESGLQLEGQSFAPAKIEEIHEGLIKLVLTEGKYHEVKLILKTLGLTYEKIVRTRFENITLEGLQPGGYRFLTQEEVKALVETAMKNRLRARSKEL